jgi:hypothetical protein
VSGEMRIRSISRSGSLITLGDSSRWSVSAADIPLVLLWNEMQRIIVKQDAAGNYTLQNVSTALKTEIKVTRRKL